MYLAKEGDPNSDAYAKLDLPASPWELWDAMDKVRLQKDDILYMEIEDYYAFEYLSPHLDGLDISLNELNDLAAQLAALDEVQGIAFEGMFSIEVQRKVNANGGVITLQDLRDLAVSAKTDCYHVVDAADDAQLGRFYAENEFIPELDGVSNEVFEMLDFAGIGRMMRCSENGVFVNSLYVLRDGELTTAPPVQKALPGKPGYLFRLTLGLHPDIGDARTVTLDLPAAEAELLDAQEQLGVEGWEGVTVIDYDGIIPYAAEFTDLPMELEELNAFTKAARDIQRSEVPKLKALLEQFEVQDIETAMLLTEHLADYILTPGISSPQEAALDQLCFIMDREEAVRLIPYVNLFNYGETVIHADNAALTSYGLLHRADYQPMQTPVYEHRLDAAKRQGRDRLFAPRFLRGVRSGAAVPGSARGSAAAGAFAGEAERDHARAVFDRAAHYSRRGKTQRHQGRLCKRLALAVARIQSVRLRYDHGGGRAGTGRLAFIPVVSERLHRSRGRPSHQGAA